VSCIIIGN